MTDSFPQVPFFNPVGLATADVSAGLLARATADAEARQQLRKKLHESPTCMASLEGPALMVAVTNKLFRELFGGRLLVGLPLRTALSALAEQSFFDLLDEVYRTGITCYGHDAVSYHDDKPAKQPRTVRFTFIGQVARDAAGAITGVLLFAYDVSSHVQALVSADDSEAQAAVTRQQLALAHEQLAVANEELDVTNEELLVSNEELNTTNTQLSATNLELALANQRLSAANELLHASNVEIRTHAKELRQAHRAVRQLNKQLEVRVAERTAELRDALRSISQANAALSQSNEQLTYTNEDLDSFVYAASHDLKQPVNNLTGLFDELRRVVTFADPAEGLLLVPLIAQALRQLTTSLEDLAALGQAQQLAQAPAEPVHLETEVEDILHTLEPQVRAARARITTDFAVRPTLSYPRASLHTVLLNLLSNALKYADPVRPARIHISLWLDGGQPVLLVEDNGLGFDAARYGDELFQLFRRFHTQIEGTGVGLYLINRLMRANGGRVEVESQVGAGATFRVYLGRPRSETAKPAA